MKHHDRKPGDRVPALESRTLGFPRTGEQLSLRTGHGERIPALGVCVLPNSPRAPDIGDAGKQRKVHAWTNGCLCTPYGSDGRLACLRS